MATYTGTSGAIIANSAVISGVKSWSLDVSASELRSSPFGSSWDLYETGIKAWSGAFEGNVDDDETQASLLDALLNGTVITLDLSMLIYGSYLRGTAQIISQSPGQDHAGLGTVSWKFVGTGALAKYRSEVSGPMLLLMTRMITQSV